MKNPTPKEWLEAKNAEALAAVPEQDASTKTAEDGIEAHRAAIAAAEKERLQNKKPRV